MKVQLKRVEFDITATAPRSITVKKWIRRWLLGVIINVCGLPGLLDTNEDVNVVLKKVPAPVRSFLELVFIPISFGLLVIGTSAAAEIKIDLQLFKLINFHVIRKDDRVGGLSRFCVLSSILAIFLFSGIATPSLAAICPKTTPSGLPTPLLVSRLLFRLLSDLSNL